MADRFATATLMFADQYSSPLPGVDQICSDAEVAADLPEATDYLEALYTAPLTGVDQIFLSSDADEMPSASTTSLYVGHCEPVVINPASGTFTGGSKQVTLTCPTSGATIRYTTDGSTPTASSTQYTTPFNVTTGTRTVKAIAIKTGLSNSVVTKATIVVTS